MNDVIDWIRGLNAILGLACFVLLLVRVMETWAHLVIAQRLYFSSLLLFCLSTVYGSIELIIGSAQFSVRAMIVTLALILLFIYLMEPRRAYRGRVGKDALGGFNFRRKK